MLNYGWQTDISLWEEMPSDIRDSSAWRSVDFRANEAVAVPDHESGIYCICASPVGRPRVEQGIHANDLFIRLYTPIYIGKTKDLRRRFIEHCSNPSQKVQAAKECFMNCLQFWFLRLPADRIDIEEARCISCFGPAANERSGVIVGKVRQPVDIGI